MEFRMMDRRRVGLLIALIILPLGLGGCDDRQAKEAAQRKAFVEFLQGRILDKPGARLPVMTAEETDRIGDYVNHYAIIQDFNKTMEGSVKGPMQEAIAKGAVRSVGDLVSRRGDIVTALQAINEMGKALETALHTANDAKSKLSQPADLKPVYDKAYARLVSDLEQAFQQSMPVVTTSLNDAIKVSDYLDQHKTEIVVSGSSVQVKDPKIASELNALLFKLNSHASDLVAAQRAFSKAAYGN
jgi:hypothetical protein